MKRISLILILSLLVSLALPAGSFAASSAQEAINTLRALQIMTGDERGDLHLDRQLTRAQLAKMLCASSFLKDRADESGLGYSVFSDVYPAHWAGQYIKLCAEQGWLSGYSDGSFRPNAPVKLEEACSACLKLMGYTASDLNGGYPSAQLNKAASLGLTDQIRGGAGTCLSRQDAAFLFSSLLGADTPQGAAYGQSLGLAVSGGKIDMIQAVGKDLKGPYVASEGERLSFIPEKIYLNGKEDAGAALSDNDVYYYNEGLASLWIYTEKTSGKIDQISPVLSPSMLVVAGRSYQIASGEVSYELSNYGSIREGDTVTLLLGMNDEVAGILKGNAVDARYIGLVQSNTRSAEEGGASVISTLTVFCTDGVVRSFECGKSSAEAGSVVSVSLSSSGAAVTILPKKTLEGVFNKAGTRFAGLELAEDIRIIDTEGAAAVTVEKEALAGRTIYENNVRYYAVEDGLVTDLILSDASGEIWTYALLTEAGGESLSVNAVFGSYVFLIDGKQGAYTSSGVRYTVSPGGIGIKYEGNAVKSIRQLEKVTVTDISGSFAFAQNIKYDIDPKAQVYLKDGDDYYLMDIKDLDPDGFKITGWYDDFGCPAGGKLRVITAGRAQ